MFQNTGRSLRMFFVAKKWKDVLAMIKLAGNWKILGMTKIMFSMVYSPNKDFLKTFYVMVPSSAQYTSMYHSTFGTITS